MNGWKPVIMSFPYFAEICAWGIRYC